MLHMRAAFAIALLMIGVAVFGVAGAGRAQAGSPGVRVAPIVIYDYQPGVRVRAYWRAPWRHRHYYPTTDKAQRDRDDDPSDDAGQAPAPAESFHREWSTSSAVSVPPDYWPAPPHETRAPAAADRNPDPNPNANANPDSRDDRIERYSDPVK
jgi:hypothetical protein